VRYGHATSASTLETYWYAIAAMREGAAQLIAGLVFTGKQELLLSRSRIL
jgi:hypothetical protein